MKSVISILSAVNINRQFQMGSNLRESHVCNIDQRDIDAMDFATDKQNWIESDEAVYVKIGEEVEIDGRAYVCKEYVGDPDADNECAGCAFDRKGFCTNLSCSIDDRRDRKNVLFVEKGGAV